MGDAEIWALPCLPLAGPGMGAYLIPEVGAGVWVEFEAGDPSYPIWSGCYWGDGQTPTDNEGTNASATLKVIRSKEGLMVTLNDKDQVITVSDKDGKNVVTIEVMAGKITVKGATKAIVEAPQIELVENATHPVVFGDQLMNYLNSVVQTYQSHMHPGQLAADSCPSPPRRRCRHCRRRRLRCSRRRSRRVDQPDSIPPQQGITQRWEPNYNRDRFQTTTLTPTRWPWTSTLPQWPWQ